MMSDLEEIPFIKRNRKSFKNSYKEATLKERIFKIISKLLFWRRKVPTLTTRIINVGGNNDLMMKNEIHTCKYNFLTFLPLNLIEQFSKLPNFYFLVAKFLIKVIAGLQTILEISNSEGRPVILFPLSIIIAVSALKDLFEDMKRRNSDFKENNEIATKCNEFGNEFIKWKDIKVGSIIKIVENQLIPADLLLFHSSNKNGTAYIETMNLDGETNLKYKFTHGKFRQYFNDPNSIHRNSMMINCEKPNPYIYSFTGTAILNDENISLSESHLILRGSVLKNTDYIYGVAVYCGHESKIMMNSQNSRAKRSTMDSKMNDEIFWIFLFQVLFCFLASGLHVIWNQYHKKRFVYLGLADKEFGPLKTFFVRYGNWMLLFTYYFVSIRNFVPISLLVTLEMVKFGQGILLSYENLMKCSNGEPPIIQTSTLNEELGQVKIVFSDKTGTLTLNQMRFNKICVNGTSYGTAAFLLNEGSSDSYKNPYVHFDDENFRIGISNKENPQHEFIKESLIGLALCHSVIVDSKGHFRGSSSDELALISFAKEYGVEFKGETVEEKLIIEVLGEIKVNR